MATRMQQRRGTAAQWISTNSGNGPVLNSGEIGYESDTNKFKIGDGVNHWVTLPYFVDLNSMIAGAPGLLNSIDELAAALGDDPAFFTTVATNLTNHQNDTTAIHGIADTSLLVTTTGTQTLTNKTITAPAGLVKGDVGLGNVDNTSDANKPVSTATQTALDLKANASAITELAQDAVNTAIVAGVGLDKVYDDTANTITLDIDSTVATLTGTQTLTNKTVALGSNTVSGTIAEFNTAVTDADLATLAGTETLTNKTLTSPTVSGLTLSDGSIVVEGTTANAFETTLSFTDPTADRTITFPDSTGTVATQEYVDSSVSGAEVVQSTLAGNGISWNAGNDQFDVDTTIIQARVADVTDTEIGYLNGVTSAIQTQLDAKAAAASYAALAGATFTGAVSGTSLTLSGDLTVNGTTTNLNSTSLVIEDKNVVLGDTATPTDTTADGGGITLKGATDKTFNWVDATDAWTSSEHINLASGKTLKYNGTDLVAAQSGNSGKYLTTDGTSTSWGTVSGYSAPTIGSTSIASGATVTTVAGLTLTSPVLTGTVTLPQGKLTGGSTTVSANTATTVSTVALADFTTMEYIVSIKQGSKVRSSKVLVQTDGTAVDSVEHSILETGGAMTGVNVTAAVSSTNCILTVTVTNASTTNAVVKVVNTII
jgi:hypothetical protein